jgi:bis(5'-nucleosyl)-tetraphosphatase (symmetrical)
MTTFAIGDVQGCHEQMFALIRQIDLVSSSRKLIFVGDLVNRGPHSLATLRYVRSLGESASVVLGNHDLHLLALAHGIRTPHSSDTMDEILNAPDRDELIDWLRHRPLANFDQGFLIVHAGVLPQWTLQQTLELAREVEHALQGPNWVNFLRVMYGNTPATWVDSLEGPDRLRCIVNAFTRLRYCSVDGTMDFESKEGSSAPSSGYMPWFDVPGRKTEEVTVVFGHWSTLGLTMRPNLIGLDTGCIWGGKLTAVRLEDRAIFQVTCPQHQKPR